MKSVPVQMIDLDFETLKNLAQAAGMTPQQLLERFVADLVSSDASAGRNERDAAQHWYACNL